MCYHDLVYNQNRGQWQCFCLAIENNKTVLSVYLRCTELEQLMKIMKWMKNISRNPGIYKKYWMNT